jgi:hypothetical protein
MTASLDLLKKIRNRGHWRTLIRPRPYSKHRLDFDRLLPLLEQTKVQFRGWDYPHVDPPHVTKHLDFIEQSTDWEHYLETFRFYQSGQFVHYAGFAEDWRDQSGLEPADNDWKAGARLGIGAAIYHFTEVFEFAARLAASAAGDEEMTVDLTSNGLADRHFYVDSATRFDIGHPRKAALDSFPFVVNLTRTQLMAEPRKYALDGLIQLFKRVPNAPHSGILADWQNEIRR